MPTTVKSDRYDMRPGFPEILLTATLSDKKYVHVRIFSRVMT